MLGMRKSVFFSLVVLLILSGVMAVTALSILRGSGSSRLHGTYINPPMEAYDFELTASEGPVRVSDYRGKIVILSFGYTSCPDVCPATMSNLARTVDQLGEEADEVQVIMVAVDPERDTPERVGRFASSFNARFVGLTGTPEQVARVAEEYGIFYQKAESTGASEYLVDHTATTMVLDREGKLRLLWPFGTTPADMASDLRFLIRNT